MYSAIMFHRCFLFFTSLAVDKYRKVMKYDPDLHHHHLGFSLVVDNIVPIRQRGVYFYCLIYLSYNRRDKSYNLKAYTFKSQRKFITTNQGTLFWEVLKLSEKGDTDNARLFHTFRVLVDKDESNPTMQLVETCFVWLSCYFVREWRLPGRLVCTSEKVPGNEIHLVTDRNKIEKQPFGGGLVTAGWKSE